MSCWRWAHSLGWRGRATTKSRRFSTTICALRQPRRDWRAAEAGETEAVGTTEWIFEGVGTRCEIDRMLGRRTTRLLAESRYEAFIDSCAARSLG